MADDTYSMWEYWRDKKGIVDALKYQYAWTLESSDFLKMCLHQIQVNELAIDMEMKRLAKKYEELEAT
jgi:hypothetical protein